MICAGIRRVGRYVTSPRIVRPPSRAGWNGPRWHEIEGATSIAFRRRGGLGTVLVEFDRAARTRGDYIVVNQPTATAQLSATIVACTANCVGVNLPAATACAVTPNAAQTVGVMEIRVSVAEVVEKCIVSGNVPCAQFRRNIVADMSTSGCFLVEQVIFDEVLARTSVREIIGCPTITSPTLIAGARMPVVPDLNYIRSISSVAAVVDVEEGIVIHPKRLPVVPFLPAQIPMTPSHTEMPLKSLLSMR